MKDVKRVIGSVLIILMACKFISSFLYDPNPEIREKINHYYSLSLLGLFAIYLGVYVWKTFFSKERLDVN